MIDHTQATLKKICWNGLELVIPQSWEAIVKSDRHLIFEQHLKPLCEIRWQHNRGKSKKNAETLIAQLANGTKGSVRVIDPPPALQRLPAYFQIRTFSRNRNSPAGAAVTCRVCGTLILLIFHPGLTSLLNTHAPLIHGLDCHRHNENGAPWRIDDMCFVLPKGLDLGPFSFAFGATRLNFSNRFCTLYLGKLASASEHLKRQGLASLFSSFCPVAKGRFLRLGEHRLIYRSAPSIAGQLMSRLRRRTPFHEARFSHYPEYDRILGFHFESTRPISEEDFQTIEHSYGIIPKEEKTDTTHP